MSDGEEEYMEGEEEENLEEEEADGEEGLAEEEDIEEGEEEDKDVTQEDEFVEEEEEREPPNPLTEEMMRDSLSMLTQIGTGLSHAFVRLDVHDKAITDISVLKKYIHLRYVTLTTNAIRDISPLGYLSHLLIVRAEQNRLNSAKIDELPYLQLASFSGNNVKSMEGINHPMLEKLFLAYNQIEKISGFDPVKIGNLRVLDLRANRLESTAGIYPPNLRELYLPTNLIKSLEGISSLVNLQILHLRDNQIETLDGFSEDMVSLQYLNLRSNNVQDFSEISKVTCLPALKVLVLCENPIAEEEEYRLEVYIQIGESLMLDRLDKEPFAMEEIEEATELMEQRLQEQMSKEPSDVTREPTNITVTSTSSRGKSSLRS